MKKILYTRADAADYADLEESVSDLIAVATVNNVARIYECLREIVPEYHANEPAAAQAPLSQPVR